MPWHRVPVVNPDTLMDSQNGIVTGVIALVLSSMVLAYMFLCCHVWGLHLRLFQLLRCAPSRNTSTERVVHRRSISLPLNMIHLRGGNAMGVAPTGGGTTPPSVTPPPRYSDVVEHLPSYSCALRRAVTVVGQPLHCRITVWGNSDDILNSSVFVGDSSPRFDRNSPGVPPPYTAHNHIPVNTPTSPSLPPCMYANCGHVSNAKHTYYPAISYNTMGSTTMTTTIHPSRDSTQISIPLHHNTPTTESTNSENHNIVKMMPSSSRYDLTRLQIHNEDKVHHSQSGDRPLQPASSEQLNREEQQYLRLWVKGDEQSQEQLVYARRTAGDCYVAYWTPPHFHPRHTLHLQVVVEGRPVDMAYVELLDLHGTQLALAPLTLLSTPQPLSSDPSILTLASDTTLTNTIEARCATAPPTLSATPPATLIA